MIRHGTYNGYQVDGCRCDDCRHATSVYQQSLYLRRSRGQVWVDAAELRRAVAEFADAGVSATGLAAAVGCSKKIAVKVLSGAGRVRASAAEPFDRRLSWDDFPDSCKVDMRLMVDLVGRLEERGWCRRRIGREVCGWVRWPGEQWLEQEKVTLRFVRAARDVLGTCEGCGGESWGGGRWCKPCFDARTLPTDRYELDVLHRRRVQREAKRRERAAA